MLYGDAALGITTRWVILLMCREYFFMLGNGLPSRHQGGCLGSVQQAAFVVIYGMLVW